MAFINKLTKKEPFCFVRLNDGEVNAIIDESSVISRGADISCKKMKEALSNIVYNTEHPDNLYIGVPCIYCYETLNKFIVEELKSKKSKSFMENNIIDANILINNNYNSTLKILLNNLGDCEVHVIISDDASASRLIEIGLNIVKTTTVPSRHAFKNKYQELSKLIPEENIVLLALCGPLGRVLCYEYYCKQPKSTFIDLGSFFDPITRNISYLYHTNNHKHCENCSPHIDKLGFTDIFRYCANDVKTEAYYFGTLNEYENLYAYNYYKIIHTLMIRINNEGRGQISDMLIEVLVKITNRPYDFLNNLVNECLTQNSNVVLINTPNIIYNSLTLIKNYGVKYVSTKQLNDLDNEKASNIFIDVPLDNSNSYILNPQIDIFMKAMSLSYDIIDKKTQVHISQISNDSLQKKFLTILEGSGVIECNFINPNYIKFCLREFENILYINKLINKLFKIFYLCQNVEAQFIIQKIILNLLFSSGIKLTEGYTFQCRKLYLDLLDSIKECCITDNMNYDILEIGFNPGTSSLLFLANTFHKVYAIDIVEHEKIINIYKYVFENRFNFIKGEASDVISLNKINRSCGPFKVIFIDGPHNFKQLFKTFLSCLDLINYHTYIIINDVVTTPENIRSWNHAPNELYRFLNENDLICNIKKCEYKNGRGFAGITLKPYKTLKDIVKKFDKNQIEALCDFNEKKTPLNSYLVEYYIDTFGISLSNEQVIESSIFLVKNDKYVLEKLIFKHPNDYIKHEMNKLLIDIYQSCESIRSQIPKIIHLIYINERPLKDYNYKCISSICDIMSDYTIMIHNDIEPNTNEWALLTIRKNVKIVKIDRERLFDDFPVKFVQYEADILRLKCLMKYGGIYFDNDIFLLKNIENLFTSHSFYYCSEATGALINCVCASTKGNGFIEYLLSGIKQGIRHPVWAWHTRVYPQQLLDAYSFLIHKYDIHILDYKYFCPIRWEDVNVLYDAKKYKSYLKDSYGIHLFETILGDHLSSSKFIQNLSVL